MANETLRSARAQVLFLALGHLVSDFYALMLSWLLPDFKHKFTLSNTQVTGIVALSGVFNSMSQPLFGYAAERHGCRKLCVVFGTFLAGVMCLMGLAPNVWVLVGIVLVGSIGVGLFHPTGAAEVFEILGPRNKLGRSLFVMAGGIGIAFGPILITKLVDYGGLRATWLVSPPAILLPIALIWLLRPSPPKRNGVRGGIFNARPEHLLVVGILFIAVVFRSAAAVGTNNLVALRCDELRYTREVRGYILSLMALFGSIGGLLGGYLTGRIGSKPIMLWSCFLAGPLLFGYAATESWMSWILLSLGTFSLAFAMPHFVMAAQELMPESAGTVSGVMMGMAWSIAGLALPLFGKISDVRNVAFAIKTLTILPILAGICVLFVKKSMLDLYSLEAAGATEK